MKRSALETLETKLFSLATGKEAIEKAEADQTDTIVLCLNPKDYINPNAPNNITIAEAKTLPAESLSSLHAIQILNRQEARISK